MTRTFAHRGIWTAWGECLETLLMPGGPHPCDGVDLALQMTMLTLLGRAPAPDGWAALANPYPPTHHAHLIPLH